MYFSMLDNIEKCSFQLPRGQGDVFTQLIWQKELPNENIHHFLSIHAESVWEKLRYLCRTFLFPSGFRISCGWVSQHPDNHHLPWGWPSTHHFQLLGHGQRWRVGPRAPLPPPAGSLFLPRQMPQLPQPEPRLQPLLPWLAEPRLQLWLPAGGGGGAEWRHHQLWALAVLEADFPWGQKA